LEDKYGYAGQIVTSKGRKFYFKNTHFDLNLQGALDIARDKDYAIYFMKKMGYPVPTWQTFF
jgi:glutathione synthase/RimK-type ligase-like ATP-grasp enzyme